MNLELTKKAGRDFERIVTFGIERFGITQSKLYTNSLKGRLDAITKHPYRYPLFEKYGDDIRRSVHRPHAIYYKVILPDTVRIMRILSRQNPSESSD